MKYINSSLITLKCVLFLFFGAIGSLFPFLPLHMNAIGLAAKDESITVSIVAPLIATIGPLVAAPLADRLAGGFGGAPRSKTGRYLRVMIAVCLVLATIFYWLLLAIPPILRSPPNVSFACDEQGGFILQDRCGADRICYNWGSTKGSVLVKKCQFSCNASSSYSGEYTTPYSEEEGVSEAPEYFESGEADQPTDPIEAQALVFNDTQPSKKEVHFIPHPHMCYKNSSGEEICEVYTEFTKQIHFSIGLKPTITSEDDEDDTCKYPFADYFHCRINPGVVDNLTSIQMDCHPVVVCEIHNPYTNENSLLKRSQCGYDNISFWLYLLIRSFADIFPAAAVTLLATAVVIATRETSTGRGDIGKQFAAGALGFGIFAPIIGGAAAGIYLYAMISFTVLMAIAVIILLVDFKMPLSPPEWWWHTRCGLLALPMSSVRKYGLEIAALGVVLFFLGVFWNAIDTFLPWHVVKIEEGEPLDIGLTVTVGAIPAVFFLIFAERIVDYCGHSNILIFCFVNYICHHLALMFIENASYILLCEWMEIFTLHIMYITSVLYLRHLVPRKFTSCGQALPIIAHFCLGRCFGALFGGMAYSEYPNNFQDVHRSFCIAAAVIAIIYFLAYHFYMKPKCAAPVHLPPDPAPAIFQNVNENGSYTPLRVYHNSKSKKGHFRY
ncbi:uncharacterized protein LOC108917887 [Anoplophora glabripennis]|uniref:uncharacterized protein LOC108917887 n=1 Tax=Anoplophora glabripennis TaxID=217634 RepID=UPI00087370B3|nr:uncharacterized protein LOC108917887 [Anoplophora glabripennis]XP_023310460.1 uncharacterized protein LOC108917887 [Anoplophora glabripennis]